MIAAQLLRAFVLRYAAERGLSPSSKLALGYAVASLEKHLGHPATVADLSSENVNAWLSALEVKPTTAKSYRRQILTLWRAVAECADFGDIRPPSRVIQVRVPPAMPRAWSLVEMGALLQTAMELRGRIRDRQTPRAAFWTAFILVGYESGLRLGDLLALRRDEIDAAGRLTVIQQKTGRVVSCCLSEQAMAWIDRMNVARGRLFVMHRRGLQDAFGQLLAKAGLSGSVKRLRATGATWCEVNRAGDASRYLGHSTPGLAAKHYIDPRHLGADKPRPPAVG